MEEMMKILHFIQGDIKSQKQDMKQMEGNIKDSINKNIDEKFAQFEKSKKIIEEKLEKQQKIVEYLDRQLRKKNIVFFGILESEQKYDDLVDLILHIINKNMNIPCSRWEIESVVRVGKKCDGKIRPIVVTISTVSRKLEILRNKRCLLCTNIYVKEDFPPHVLQKRKELQEDLMKEKEAGNRVALHYDKIVKLRSHPLKSSNTVSVQSNKRVLSESPEYINTTSSCPAVQKTRQAKKKTKSQNITSFLRPSQITVQESPTNRPTTSFNIPSASNNIQQKPKQLSSPSPPSPSRPVTEEKSDQIPL